MSSSTPMIVPGAAPALVWPCADPCETLKQARDSFETSEANGAMEGIRLLRDGMHAARNEFTDEADWRSFIATRVRPHPALCLAHEDPFIRRAFAKPRGYAGDAVLLDFIYHHPANRARVATAPPRGRAALGFSTNTPAPRAVRNRACLLANEIDAVCARAPRAAILSMACGHLREARDSCALEAGAFGRFVALDQDVESLEVVRRDTGPLGVEAMEGSVKTVIARGPRLGSFDFIYAAGLFDYLNDRVAARLLCTLAGMLKRGGKLWVANFLPGIVDRGFMESFMDWWLIYRTPRQMLEIADALPPGGCSSRRTFVEPESNIVFLEVRR